MSRRASREQELREGAGLGLVVPVASHRVGVCLRPGSDESLVCLELVGDDNRAVRYGLSTREALTLALGLLRRLEAPPFNARRELAAIASRLVDELTGRARKNGRG